MRAGIDTPKPAGRGALLAGGAEARCCVAPFLLRKACSPILGNIRDALAALASSTTCKQGPKRAKPAPASMHPALWPRPVKATGIHALRSTMNPGCKLYGAKIRLTTQGSTAETRGGRAATTDPESCSSRRLCLRQGDHLVFCSSTSTNPVL